MMKVLITLSLFFFVTNVYPCKRSAEEQDKAIKEKLTLEWKTLPRYQWAKFDVLPFKLKNVTKASDSSGNYFVDIQRGETRCKRLTYSIESQADCSINPTLIAIEACLAD